METNCIFTNSNVSLHKMWGNILQNPDNEEMHVKYHKSVVIQSVLLKIAGRYVILCFFLRVINSICTDTKVIYYKLL